MASVVSNSKKEFGPTFGRSLSVNRKSGSQTVCWQCECM